jgi:hypothetical protein
VDSGPTDRRCLADRVKAPSQPHIYIQGHGSIS